MTSEELFKRDDWKIHKKNGFKQLSKYYTKQDDAEFWYNRYLLQLLKNKLNPSFSNPDELGNRVIFTGIYQDIGAGYFIEKLIYLFNNGLINKMFFNPQRYVNELTATETGKTFADLAKEAIIKTGSDIKQTTAAAAETVGDTFDMLKNLLPLILIIAVYMLIQTYAPVKR